MPHSHRHDSPSRFVPATIIAPPELATRTAAASTMPDTDERPNLLFRLTAAAAALFVFTVLALVATIFGDPAAPLTAFLGEHGGTLIAVEVVVTLVLGLLAMFVDRRRTLREADEAGSLATAAPDRERPESAESGPSEG